ncbi:MAG: radical SAM protein [Candidatus Omnitrophica bacterium]|nr:radical SAM protein [Candidatus Omnitrophota bacterium]
MRIVFVKKLLEIELTNNCNAHCIMCPVHRMKRKKGFMTIEVFEGIITKSQKYGMEWIRLCGIGEPLLHKYFCKYVEYVKDRTNCKVELITNGALLTGKKISELMKNKVDRISISFPSITKKNYERIMRGLTYEDVLKKVLYLIKISQDVPDVNIRITVIVTKFNCNEIPAIRAFFNEKGITDIMVHLPHNRGGYLENFYNIIDRHYYLVNRVEKRKTYCPWPLSAFYIAWDGTALLCCCDLENSFNLGNIKEVDLETIDKLQQTVNFITPNLCKNCSYCYSKFSI